MHFKKSGTFLPRSMGGNVEAADHFKHILFPEDYFDKIAVEIPTVGEMGDLVRVECEPLPQDFLHLTFNLTLPRL